MMKLDKILQTFNNDIILSAPQMISSFCKPLYKLGITEFTYVQFLNDGRRIYLCSNLEWAIDYLINFFDLHYVDNVINELNLNNKNICIYDEMSGNSVLIDATEKFNIRNAIGLFTKTNAGQEIFYFASKNESKYMLNCYLNSLDFLKKFRFYFSEKAKKIIQLSYEANFQTPKDYYEIIKGKLEVGADNFNIGSDLPVKKYLLGDVFNNQYLTAREVECIKWSLLGKTAEEAAMILSVSKRTVEVHLENAKQKLNCNNKHQLIGKVIELGILKPSID